MKLHALALFLMCAWDASLHVVEYLGIQATYPLYLTFPFFGIPYTIFWSIFWTIGAIFAATLIWPKKISPPTISKEDFGKAMKEILSTYKSKEESEPRIVDFGDEAMQVAFSRDLDKKQAKTIFPKQEATK